MFIITSMTIDGDDIPVLFKGFVLKFFFLIFNSILFLAYLLLSLETFYFDLHVYSFSSL